MSTSPPAVRRLLVPWQPGPGWIVALALAALLIVNPFRELMTEDDGWAYARSVLELLTRGDYRLDAWSAANMPVQIHLAAALAKVFGYSLSLLRCSTLALLAVGLASFYALLRELGSSRGQATLFTSALLASPLVLMLGFTFMSDVPFLGWLLLACWLYARGLMHRRKLPLLLGSLAAACAIGTRQFGLILLGGWLLLAIASRSPERPDWKSMAVALAAPGLAAIWQVVTGWHAPNFTQAFRLAEQQAFLALPASRLFAEMAWRLGMMAQYLGVLLLPALPLVAMLWRRSAGASRPWQPAVAVLAIGSMLWAWGVGSDLTARVPSDSRWVGLPLHWMLPTYLDGHPQAARALNAAGLVMAGMLAWLLVRRLPSHCRPSPPGWLFIGTAISAVVLHLCYVQFNDTYLIVLLPLALLLMAGCCRQASLTPPSIVVALVWLMAATLLTALAIRASYNRQQAWWNAGETALSRGTAAPMVAGSRHWAEYHGAFDDWLAAGAPGFTAASATGKRGGDDPLHDPFHRWLALRGWHAPLRVQADDVAPPAGWDVVHSFAYRDAWWRERHVRLLERRPGTPP